MVMGGGAYVDNEGDVGMSGNAGKESGEEGGKRVEDDGFGWR